VAHEVLDADEAHARWPQLSLPDGTRVLFQERTAIVPAARGVATMQRQAVAHGAVLRDRTAVRAVVPRADGVDIVTDDGVVSAARVVISADAWTSALLAPLGWDLPLTVTEEQVTYFAPADPEPFRPSRFPVWIWMDEPSYYGFPCYGEDTVKAAQDCGGPVVTGDARSGVEDPEMLARLAGFMAATFPASGPAVRSKRCLYTLTPDRDFVVSRVPGHPQVTVGLGAAHGYKFAATFGRLLTDVAVDGTTDADISAFALDRPGLTDPAYVANWMV
jgi:sarcosine oxidase